MTRWTWLLAGALASACGIVLIPEGVVHDVAYQVIATAAIVVMLMGVRRNRPEHRWPWYLLVAGLATWVLGDAIYSWYQDVTQATPFPSVADVAYVAAYAILFTGLVALVRSRGPGHSAIAVVDSSIVTIGFLLCSWVFLISPTWTTTEGPVLNRIIAAAYPVGDVLLFAVLVRLVNAHGVRNTSLWLLIASFASLVVADTLFELTSFLPWLDSHESLIDPLWLATYVLWAASALHPTMREIAAPTRANGHTAQVGQLVGLAMVAMVCPAILAVEMITGAPLHVLAVVIVSSAMVGLLAARMTHLVRQLQRQAEQLQRRADTDDVTGRLNQRHFVDSLADLLDDPEQPAATLLLIDLVGFGELNRTLGHHPGEALLRAVGERVQALAGDAATVARMAGDTFGVLDPSISAGPEADVAAACYRGLLEKPYDLPNLTLSVEVRIGIVLVPEDGHEALLALRRADASLSAASGRPDRTARYGADLGAGSTLAIRLAGELAAAITHDDIVLCYQPQVELRTGRVLGVEALARWQHPVHGLVGPDMFIAGAEQTGLIRPLTRHVLDRALAQCGLWRAAGLDLTVAVNLSVRNLLDPDLVADVRAALARHCLDASVLELEITEGTAMADPRRSMLVLDSLAEMGVTLSIDDYGTGHSSLAYLQQLPVRRLKIDRSFVTDILTDVASAAIVRSTIELARHLQLDVVAEGVEDDATLVVLEEMHCFAVQGYGLGRPVPAAAIPELVSTIETRLPDVLRLRPAMLRSVDLPTG